VGDRFAQPVDFVDWERGVCISQKNLIETRTAGRLLVAGEPAQPVDL
jgi:hypothetical protein